MRNGVLLFSTYIPRQMRSYLILFSTKSSDLTHSYHLHRKSTFCLLVMKIRIHVCSEQLYIKTKAKVTEPYVFAFLKNVSVRHCKRLIINFLKKHWRKLFLAGGFYTLPSTLSTLKRSSSQIKVEQEILFFLMRLFNFRKSKAFIYFQSNKVDLLSNHGLISWRFVNIHSIKVTR